MESSNENGLKNNEESSLVQTNGISKDQISLKIRNKVTPPPVMPKSSKNPPLENSVTNGGRAGRGYSPGINNGGCHPSPNYSAKNGLIINNNCDLTEVSDLVQPVVNSVVTLSKIFDNPTPVGNYNNNNNYNHNHNHTNTTLSKTLDNPTPKVPIDPQQAIKSYSPIDNRVIKSYDHYSISRSKMIIDDEVENKSPQFSQSQSSYTSSSLSTTTTPQNIRFPQTWKTGLVHATLNRYLTAETYGFKINASGTSLRKKQTWTIEHDPAEDDTVYLKSHLGRYLTADKRGNLSCESEESGAEEKFSIVYSSNWNSAAGGEGKWAFRNKSSGFYLGGKTEDNLRCYEKQPGPGEWWFVHLAIHPQVNLKNLNRQKYVCLQKASSIDSGIEDGLANTLQISSVVPWGDNCIVTIEYYEGKYRLRSFDDRYLHKDGMLVQSPDPDNTSFSLEIRSGQFSGIAFRDSSGLYLSGVGREAIVKSKNKSVGKDELFALEDTKPQVCLVAHNGKMLSIKQGVDPAANQDDSMTEKEIFQLEFDKVSEHWRILTADNKYWSLETGNGIQASSNKKSDKGLFELVWQESGKVALKSLVNKRYLISRMNGSLFAVSEEVTSTKECFNICLVNKPRLILKTEYGFVGLKTGSNRYECNKTNFDTIQLLQNNFKQPFYYLLSHNNNYWNIEEGGDLTASSSKPIPFFLLLQPNFKLVIKHVRCGVDDKVAGGGEGGGDDSKFGDDGLSQGGKYLVAQQNGLIIASGDSLEKATFWEY